MAKKISKVLASERNYQVRPFALVDHEHEFYPNTVADLTARDAITAPLRYEGVIVYVKSDNTTYQLRGGDANANWVTLVSAGGVSSHVELADIGTNTHAQIDTHIADSTIHFTMASISITESQISDLGAYALAAHNHDATYLGISDTAVAADALGTTGADVNVSAAAPPVAGQILTATSATAATWQNPAAAGVGDIIQVGTMANTYIAYFTGDKNLSGNAKFSYDDATELFTLAGVSPEFRLQDDNNPGTTMTASLSFWDSTGVAAEIRMDGTGDLRIENADGEIRFDTGTSDVVVSGNGDLSVGNDLSVTGYLAGYGGTPADGSVLMWVTANTRAEFTLGVVMAAGTPVNNQIAVFSAAAQIDGDANFTWDGADFIAGELFWDGSLNRLSVGDGTVATAGIIANSTATGSTFLQLSQAGTVRTTLRFADATDRTELSSSANNITFRPGNVDTVTITQALTTVTNALTVTGAFTSPGIKDVATARRMQVGNSLLSLGASGVAYVLASEDDAQALYISGGSSAGSGGNVLLIGGTHAQAGDFHLRSANENVVSWDESAGTLNVYTGAGVSKTLGLLLNSAQQLTVYSTISVSAVTPQYRLQQTGGALDQKWWLERAISERNERYISDDAFVNTYIWMSVERSGTGASVQVDTIDLTAVTDVTVNSATFHVAGNITTTGTVDGVDVAGLSSAYTSHAADSTIHFTEASISIPLTQISDVTATAAEVNLLDLAGLTAGWILSADTATTASWKAPAAGGIGGSIADNQIAIGATTADDIEGSSALTYDLTELRIANAGPKLIIDDTDATLDDKIWSIEATAVTNNALDFKVYDDAEANEYLWMRATRSGTGASIDVSIIEMFPATSFITPSMLNNVTATTFGDGSTTASYKLGIRTLTNAVFDLGQTSSAIIRLYGSTHATLPHAVYIQSFGGYFFRWQESAGALTIRSGVGTKSTALTINSSQQTVFSGEAVFSASSTARPSMSIPEGTAPTAPADGDIWLTAAGELFARLNGTSIDVAGSLRMAERADHMYTAAAGFGEVWVKNDTPNLLMFTDDASTDHKISPIISTWTPTLLGSSTNPTQTYLSQTGEYTRLGNIVFFSGSIIMAASGITAGSGTAHVGGIPFDIKAGISFAFNVTGGTWSTSNAGAPSHGVAPANGTQLDLYVYDNDAGNVAGTATANAADVQNLTSVQITGWYETDAA